MRQQVWPVVSAWVAVVLLATGVARAAGSDQGGFDPGDLGQAIIAVVIFLVLLLVLGKFAWGPIIAQLRSREDHIGQSVTHAEKTRTQAEELLARYQARIQGAREEVEQILTAARAEAEKHRQELLVQARQEAERSIKYAKREIAMARDETMQEMREVTARMAVELAQRVLQRELGDDDQDRILRDTLEDIRQHAAEEA